MSFKDYLSCGWLCPLHHADTCLLHLQKTWSGSGNGQTLLCYLYTGIILSITLSLSMALSSNSVATYFPLTYDLLTWNRSLLNNKPGSRRYWQMLLHLSVSLCPLCCNSVCQQPWACATTPPQQPLICEFVMTRPVITPWFCIMSLCCLSSPAQICVCAHTSPVELWKSSWEMYHQCVNLEPGLSHRLFILSPDITKLVFCLFFKSTITKSTS